MENIIEKRFLVKPLDCHLKGLFNKVDRLDHNRATRQMKDCIAFLQIEAERLDLEGGRI